MEKMKHTKGYLYLTQHVMQDQHYFIEYDGPEGRETAMDNIDPVEGQDMVDRVNMLVEKNKQLLEACEWAYAVLDGYDPPLDDEPYQRYIEGFKELQEAITAAEGTD